ncbi:MAG TPA: hypothetical protein GXX33_03615 [Firmicutes bacterium]|nr:hypothetical protein [Bacillota bacterium]
MPVAAGLGERTEQAFFAQTGTTRAADAKGRTSGKEAGDRKFERLFQGMVRTEKEKGKERPPNRPVANDELRSQLMLLYPELSTSALDQGQVAAGEADGEFLNALPNAEDLQTLTPTAEAVLAALTEAPAEAGWAEAVATGLANYLPEETVDNKALEGTLPAQAAALAVQEGTRRLKPPGAKHPAQAAALAVQEGEENSVFQPEDLAEAASEGIDDDAQLGLKAETTGFEAHINTSEIPARTEPAGNTGIMGMVTTAAGENPHHRGHYTTVKIMGMVATAAGENPGAKLASGMMGTFKAAGEATGSETEGRTENAETTWQGGRPETAGDHDGWEALSATAEREPKTVLKTGKTRLNGELLGQNFSPVAGEAVHHEESLEDPTAAPEPFAPVITREDLAAQIVSGARLMVKDGMTKIQIQLEPAELGKLELSLVVERDLVAARFVTESQGVQSLIEANLPQLRAALEEAGMQVDLLQVSVQTGTDSQLPNQNMAGGEHFRQNTGWNPTAEMFMVEEPILGEEAWHGMVNLRI